MGASATSAPTTVSVADLLARLSAEGLSVPATGSRRHGAPTRHRHAAHRPPLTPTRYSIAALGVAGAVVIGASSASAASQTGAIASAGSIGGSAGHASVQQAPLPDAAGAAVLQSADTRVSRNKRQPLVDPLTSRPSTTTLKPGLSSVGPGQAGVIVAAASVPGNWTLPTNGRFTSCFCARWGTFHEGIDLAGPLGQPIYAVGDGVVIAAGPAEGFGNWVVIQHANGDVTIYGHMRYFSVHVGQQVKAGEQIALIGSEGQATGPHLHLGVRQGGLTGPYIDPLPWLAARGVHVGAYTGD